MPFDIQPVHIAAVAVALIVVIAFIAYRKTSRDDEQNREMKKTLHEGVSDPLKEKVVQRVEPSFASKSAQDAKSVSPAAGGEAKPETRDPEKKETERRSNLRAEIMERLSGVKPVEAAPANDAADDSGGPAYMTRPASRIPDSRSATRADPGIEAVVQFTPRAGCFDTAAVKKIDSIVGTEKFTKRVRLDFFNGATRRWSSDPAAAGDCVQINMSMLLASRAGSADAMEMSHFLNLADQIAIEMEADATLPEQDAMLAAAAGLQQVIARYDRVLTVRLSGNAEIPAEKLEGIASANGFSSCSDGSHYEQGVFGPGFPDLFLARDDDGRSLLLSLDVPVAPAPAKPLSKFFCVANDICCKLGLAMTDLSGRPIGAASATSISSQLRQLHKEMIANAISPGSERARSLFARA